MAKAHFVKAARKDNPVAKKGESYWWWKPMIGGRGAAKRFSKERPLPLQLTNSEFLSRFYGIEEQIGEAKDADTLEGLATEIEELGNEQNEKLDNMPEALRDGDTGQMLQERYDGCSEWVGEVSRIAEELRSKLEEREVLRAEWAAYDEQEESNERNDLADDEIDEPDTERPPETDEDLISGAVEEIQGSTPSF
jgi:hypothetical protein